MKARVRGSTHFCQGFGALVDSIWVVEALLVGACYV